MELTTAKRNWHSRMGCAIVRRSTRSRNPSVSSEFRIPRNSVFKLNLCDNVSQNPRHLSPRILETYPQMPAIKHFLTLTTKIEAAHKNLRLVLARSTLEAVLLVDSTNRATHLAHNQLHLPR
ncbi:protein of unknown function (plasmid) [Cupriavidus taiwanensis]|uniref:Uncharacterized protein n=1 Tax=Cupriavidus taiwanensis TaxID=164546 RepID=A0A375FIX1_9BURK|nr:protein of unknown function [Cupriavidus taiwanensis]SPA57435.1 protein of unknown function [Cupriavidus taiwanensis]SPD49263.1 protein of unknown function [Cupriavidus taiwanensis]